MPLSVKQLLAYDNRTEWQDWRWQWRQRVTNLDDFSQLLNGAAKPIQERLKELQNQKLPLPFGVTPYYLSLTDLSDPDCPLLRQILPTISELHDTRFTRLDPLKEEESMVLPGLVRRFSDRVLWYLAPVCSVYCRFCMRKRLFDNQDENSPSNWLSIINYIEKEKGIKEVILSGGDPLTLSDEKLEHILTRLRQIDHLISIRIHTRLPVTLPMRITPELAAIFQRVYPLTIVAHFNHPREITPTVAVAIKRLRLSGVATLNQSVLLRQINDNANTMESLLVELVRIGVMPYYLHQCDEVHGNSHFYVEPARGLEIIKNIREKNPGITVPRYVIDRPGATGKMNVMQ